MVSKARYSFSALRLACLRKKFIFEASSIEPIRSLICWEDIPAIGMLMSQRPLTETVSRHAFLQDKEIGKRQELLIPIGEGSLQIIHNSQFVTDLVKKISGPIKLPLAFCGGNRPRLYCPGLLQ